MLKVIIWGIGGRLGHTLLECLNKKEDAVAVAGFDKFANPAAFNIPVFNNVDDINVDADVIIDFSRPDAIYDMLPYAKAHKLNVVLCTTGHNDKDMEFIHNYAKDIAIFKASNMSLGVNLLIELVKKAASFLNSGFDIEIIEQHHNVKVDSPSGTALTIAKAINGEYNNSKEFVYGRHSVNQRRTPNEIGIHAVRGGTVVGKHDVLFLGNDEILTIKHEAQSKAIFAEGAIRAGHFLADKKNGMYDMPDILNNESDSITIKNVAFDDIMSKVSEIRKTHTIESFRTSQNADGLYDIEIITK